MQVGTLDTTSFTDFVFFLEKSPSLLYILWIEPLLTLPKVKILRLSFFDSYVTRCCPICDIM